MITSDLMSSNRLVLMPYAQGATFGVSDNEARSVTKLLSTTDTAYLKTDTQNAQSMEKEAGDVDGPFELGLMVEDEQDGKKTSLLYFTSESILDDSVDSMVSGANSALVAKGITQMVGEKESTIAIPAKSYESEKIVVPDSTTLMLAIIVVGVVPLLIMLAGIFVWNRRRKREDNLVSTELYSRIPNECGEDYIFSTLFFYGIIIEYASLVHILSS